MGYKTCKVKLDIKYWYINHNDFLDNLLNSFSKDDPRKTKAIDLVTKEFKIDELWINDELNNSLTIDNIEIIDITRVECLEISIIAVVRTNIDKIKSIQINYDLYKESGDNYYIDDEMVRYCSTHLQ